MKRALALCKRCGFLALAVLLLALIPSLLERATFEPIPVGARATHVLIEKSARRLTLLRGPDVLKSYTVSLGREPLGAKEFEGDGKTPEGEYLLDWRKEDSQFHLALHISYPNAADLAHAEASERSAGGLIMIHGLRNGLGWLGPVHRLFDWTDGCIALTNREIEELWRVISDGTRVEVRP